MDLVAKHLQPGYGPRLHRRVQHMQTISFDIGGTHLRAGIVNSAEPWAHVVERPVRKRVHERLEDREPARDWDQVRSFVFNYAEQMATKVAPDSPIAATFPGPVDEQGNVVGAPTLIGAAREISDLHARTRGGVRSPMKITLCTRRWLRTVGRCRSSGTPSAPSRGHCGCA